MTKNELIAKLAKRHPLPKVKDTEYAVKVILDAIKDGLLAGRRIEMRGFGNFSVHYRRPRQAQNPKTGEKFTTPPKYVPHFKVGKELRERVSRSGA